MKNYLLLALAAVVLCFTACKKDNPVTGVSLDKTMVALEIGDSDTLTATVAPDDATNKDVDWSVADDAIATVEDGVVTAVAAGQTTVTVTTVDGGFTASATITVAESIIKVTGISLDKTMVALEIGDSDTLTATVAPDNAKNKDVEWSVADDAIATVEDGVVKAVAIGETTVTVTTVDGGFTASATITVVESIIKVTGVTLDKPGLELEIGDSDTLTATVAPDDATNKGVEWSVADDAIATVEDGVVTAVAAGQTTVTVTAVDGGFTASANVVVKAAPIKVTGVSLDKTMVTLEIDESATVQAIITPSNATNKAVEWSVADATIASVNNGEVKGLKEGETTLTATTADGGFTATIPVKVVTEKIPVTQLALIYPSEVKVGNSGTLTVFFLPTNATNLNSTFIIDKPECVELSYQQTNGNQVIYSLKGVKEGTVKIKAVSEDGNIESNEGTTVVLPIIKVSSITISPETATIEKGNTKQLTAAVLPNDAENKEIEWSSSDTAVATVDVNGLVTGVAEGEVTITATAKDGSGVKGIATITVIVPPTSVTFDGKTDQEIYTWWGKEVDLKAEVTPEGVSLKHLTWRWNDPNASSNPDGLKYNVTDDKATLTYTWPSQTSKLRGVDVRAFYGDGNTVFAKANVYFQTFAWLLKYNGNAINYDGLYPLNEGFDNKWNWEDKKPNKLAFIAYYRSSTGNENAMPLYNKEYYIPTSEYTLTSSDPSKVKVTKSADGESWEIERLNTTDLVAVTLTYKCGEHTLTYTINLIP